MSIAKIQDDSKGFTLLELMVAVAVFVFVVLIGTGAFLTVLNAQRKASSLRVAQDNIRFTMEYMTKEIRMGTLYTCGGTEGVLGPQDCDFGSGKNYLTFRNDDGAVVVYKLSGGSSGRLQKSVGGSTYYVSSSESDLTFKSLTFYVTGTGNGAADQEQPKVTITAEVEADAGKTKSTFNLQTTVSQRSLDS
ncbi:MAG: hypothetical protein A3A94_01630 [Candidatus Portnoybacteria bacterium RIFCSPLOWO2_01_FULL_43_11]|uniref:Prepilin-type N-terminal cleavage/methylation domain-containing protein n=4 Tax=Candidatus Portnoyibacteriota TaxID=1817913 RepID=A0A1G2FDE6_9BACT|nr:MAG: hypothetical protein A2815_00375 [Candidatus Portnoybacteria bacterium RIFCSPHIGHO2_01_FULL_40_12b]OGZ37798.1 MAG: hypothetical protein A3E90_02150 [Candidatus Portnoybacteria bacterium RIFCSPHIGHO2_12_FULL_40_11]OGZ39166.1 MAG: hypothetical protein A3A94_01630 [Candidatus Portnoybacteria bacterium RIFCSPLOWO2_01_FULL_43_11]OGZ39896.1 MAG: hypothetical protein A3I20_02785 [Candidatus Portnoybacteria bacterium RIFCSPLOWO2_02_FULL_40_15]